METCSRHVEAAQVLQGCKGLQCQESSVGTEGLQPDGAQTCEEVAKLVSCQVWPQALLCRTNVCLTDLKLQELHSLITCAAMCHAVQLGDVCVGMKLGMSDK